jgi:pyruvate-ferredoxin/flavodoxin oxidoreductase
MLKSLAGVREQVGTADADQVRAEFAQTLAARLMEMAASGELLNGAPMVATPGGTTTGAVAAIAAPAVATNGSSAGDYTAPWIDSAQCTSCDECIGINPKIFAYGDDKHAYVKNPKGGPYKDLVRAAEKCTAQVIHPGTPFDPKEKDAEKLMKRAAKYN